MLMIQTSFKHKTVTKSCDLPTVGNLLSIISVNLFQVKNQVRYPGVRFFGTNGDRRPVIIHKLHIFRHTTLPGS